MGAYSRLGANLRLGAYSNKYGKHSKENPITVSLSLSFVNRHGRGVFN